MASFVPPPEGLSAEQLEVLCQKAYASVDILLANTKSEALNADGNAWNVVLERKDLQLKVYSSETKDSSLKRFKAIALLSDITPQQLIDFIGDREHRKTWDRNIADLQTVDLATDERGTVAVLRSCTKKVGPIAGRDFVDVTVVHTLGDGSVVNCGTGLEVVDAFGLFPPATKQFVRGFNLAGTGWHIEFEPSMKGVKVSYVIQTDLRGWFLPVIINQAIGGSYVSFFEDLRSALAKRGKSGES